MNLIQSIEECAKIPSFSTYEERIHPFIRQYISEIDHAELDVIYENNLVVNIPGKRSDFTVAITSHLDKINHFGVTPPHILEFCFENGRLHGQLDDAIGVGICLFLMRQSIQKNWPNLIVLFSEMEESFGLRFHPHLLKNNGHDVEPQIGARRLCRYLDENRIMPALFITIDTTPLFEGRPGIALYTEHWEKTAVFPDEDLEQKMASIRSFFVKHNNDMLLANGNNDYLEYGKHFGVPEKGNIPSIAIEPAIFPYHQIGESVFVNNVNEIVRLLDIFLSEFDFKFGELSST